jgi:diphthine-ammonia ligase
VIQDDKDFATVAYLRIKSATLEEKGNHIAPSLPSTPSALDSSSENVYAAATAVATVKNPRGPHPPIALNLNQSSKAHRGKWLALGNVTCPRGNVQSIEDETLGCFNVMKGANLFFKMRQLTLTF